MDNLTHKTIKQYKHDTDDGTIIITAITDKTTHMIEWWGHVEGYGVALLLYGFSGDTLKNTNMTMEQYAEYLAYENYEYIIDSKGD